MFYVGRLLGVSCLWGELSVILLNKDLTGEPISDTQDKTEGTENPSSSETDSSACWSIDGVIFLHGHSV